MEVRLLGGVAEAPRAQWNALVGDESPFLEWEWLATLEETGCVGPGTGWQALPVTVWEGGTLVGACPLYVKHDSQGEFVFDHGWALAAERAGIPYYPKLVAGVPFTPVAGARLLALAGREAEVTARLAAEIEALVAGGRVSSAHVDFCRPLEVAALGARGWLHRTGYQYHWRGEGVRTFEEYLATLRHKRRGQIRREQRALAAQGVTIAPCRGEEVSPALMQTMFALYCRTIEAYGPWSSRYLTAAFFARIRERFAHRLCLIVARLGEEIVAATLNVEKGPAFYGRYWGAVRPLRHLHFNVAYYAAIAHCIASGRTRFEPGAGGEWKHQRGFDAVVTHSMHRIADPRLAAAVRDWLAHEREAVAADVAWHAGRTAYRRD